MSTSRNEAIEQGRTDAAANAVDDAADDESQTSPAVKNYGTNPLRGWGNYVDDQWDEAGPLQLVADTRTQVLFDTAGATIESQLPVDILEDPDPARRTMVDGDNSLILGRNGDAYLVTIEFKAKPTNANSTILEADIDIGGGIPPLYGRTFTFPKGVNVEKNVTFTTSIYTLNTWEANGGKFYLKGSNTFDIYDFRIVMNRLYKAR